MHICPAVRTRCCSLMDEIRILQYWNQVTKPKILDYSDTIMRYFSVFLEFYEYFTEIDRKEIVYHYLYFVEVKYDHHVCLENNLIIEETPQDAEKNVSKLVPGGNGPLYKLNIEKPIVVDDIKTQTIYNMYKDDVANISQYLQELGQKIVANKRLVDSKKLKEQQEKISKAVLKKSFEIQKELALELKEKAEKANIFAKMGLKTPQIQLPSLQPPEIPDEIKFAGISEEDKKMKAEFDQLGIKVPHYLYNMITIRRFMDKMNKDKSLLKDPFFPNILNAINVSIGPDNQKRVPEIPFQDRNVPKIECSKQKKSFIRPFVIANYDKLKYCHEVLDKFFEFDPQGYLDIQLELKTNLNRILDLKKNFYCDMCNFNKQQFFDFYNNRMVFDRQFCKNLLVGNKAFIEFNNITFIRYLNQMLEIKQCLEHGGNSYDFPFITKVHHLIRKIPYFEECLENLDTKDYYRYCRFICMDYKYNDFSEMIEGHLHLFSQVYTSILSLLTKFTEAQHLTLATINRQKLKTHIQKIEDIIEASKFLTKQKVNDDVKKLNDLIEETEVEIGKMPEKMQEDFVDLSITNESLKQYIDEEFEEFEPKDIFEKQQEEVEDEGENFGFQEHRISPEFYLKAKQPVKIDDMKPFFARHQDALNPYEEVSLVNFKYNITNLIKDQMAKITIPKIQPNVIKNYLQVTEQNLKNFEKDIYFKIDKTISKGKSKVIPIFKPKKVRYRKYRKTKNRSLDWLQSYLEPNNKDNREKLMDQLFHKLPKY